MSKSRETPPQTASDNRNWLTGWALFLPRLGTPWVRLKLSAFFSGIVTP